MPSRQQVSFHNDEEMRKRAQEAQIARQQQDYHALLQYQQQSGLMAQQAGYGQQAAQQAHGHAQEMAALHTDLQGRLSQVQLNQQEQVRFNRMQAARASVEDDPDLAPEERRHLIVQIESGLNPLENRQREAQMLQSHLASRALAQQTDQQATMFNQRQERLAAGLAGRMQVLTDPLTGRQQLFGMDLEGNMQPLDFSQSQAHHEAQLQHLQAQTQATQQGTAQSAEAHPLQMQSRELANQQLQETMGHAREIHPLDVTRLRQANQLMAQHIEQGPATFELAQLRGYADLAGLQQQIGQRIQEQPHHLGLLSANAQIAQARAAAEPTNTALAQAAQRATIAHTNAATEHTNAIVERMPSVQQAAAQHGAESQHAVDTADAARLTLRRLQAGGLPDSVARDIANHVITEVNAEIRDAEQDVRNSIPGTAAGDTASARLHRLQANRNQRAAEFANRQEDLFRQMSGMRPRQQQDGGGGGGQGNAAPVAPSPFDPSRPETMNETQRATMTGFDALQRRTAGLPADRQRHTLTLIIQLRQLLSQYGTPEAMPANIRQQYERLGQQIRQLLPPARERGPWNNPHNEPNPFPAG